MKDIRFIDLFSGIGGIREGFEQAARTRDLNPICVFSSEIKESAIKVFHRNHHGEVMTGDITSVDPMSIPDFDVLLAGFPCQAFSSAGKRQGFNDTRGTLFFNVASILKAKKPFGFVLENVEGLVNHDMEHAKKDSKIGRTLSVILRTLRDLGYETTWKVLNACEYGVPQERKRVYIVGTLCGAPDLSSFQKRKTTLRSVLETGLPCSNSPFVKKLLSLYSVSDLVGKAIKDKRGGNNNIHSWDLETKGPVSARQKLLLNTMLKKRRSHKWAELYGLDWMDGMPMTAEMIRTFWNEDGLKEDLRYLTEKRYLRFEHPKKKVDDGNGASHREPALDKPKGYNLVAGKKSFEVNVILNPDGFAPTLVAMDMGGIYVPDGKGIRPLSMREGLRLFGYPDNFSFDTTRLREMRIYDDYVISKEIEKSNKKQELKEMFKEEIQKPRERLVNETDEEYERYLREFYNGGNPKS